MRITSIFQAGSAARIFTAILLVCLASGCASTSVFHAYPLQVKPIIRDLKEGKQVDLSTTFEAGLKSRDQILYLMERGRIAQIQGQTETSSSDFRLAIEAIKQNDQKAVLTASGGAAQTAALLVNDNAIPYAGCGYERVFVHHYQAWNYLMGGDIEGAGVELRIAGTEQDSSLKAHAKEVEGTLRKAQAQHVKVPLDNSELKKTFSDMDQAADLVKNSFQNAYTFFLSGLVRELLKEENDAYIDYRKALEIFPGNDYLQRDVLRLAIKLDMSDDTDRFRALYPDAYKAVTEGETRCSLGLSEIEFNIWLDRLRAPFEKRDNESLRVIVAEFRRDYEKNPCRNRIENALFLQLKTAEQYASWYAHGIKWGITGDEFKKWFRKIRLPYEKQDKEGLRGVISEFRIAQSANPDAAQIEAALVTKLSETSTTSPEAQDCRTISETEFNLWTEKLRLPFDARDNAGMQSVIAAFREAFKTYQDAAEAERALVLRLRISERRKTLAFGTNQVSRSELVVFFEDDFVPEKKEIKIPLPVLSAGCIAAVAFPIYTGGPTATTPLSVCDSEGALGDAQPICYVGSMSVMALKEEIPAIVARQMIRTTTKLLASKAINNAARSQSTKSGSDALLAACVAVGTSAYNVLTENADLRSWMTLPNAVQIMRTDISAGAHSIEFVHNASGARAKVDIDSKLGGKVFVRVTRTGERLYCNAASF